MIENGMETNLHEMAQQLNALCHSCLGGLMKLSGCDYDVCIENTECNDVVLAMQQACTDNDTFQDDFGHPVKVIDLLNMTMQSCTGGGGGGSGGGHGGGHGGGACAETIQLPRNHAIFKKFTPAKCH